MVINVSLEYAQEAQNIIYHLSDTLREAPQIKCTAVTTVLSI